MTLPKAIICDIDKTLSNCDHRMHHLDPSLRKDCYYFPEPSTLQQMAGWYYLDDVTYPKSRVKFKKNYDAFFAEMGKDGIIRGTWDIISMYALEKRTITEIIFITGRPEKYREVTVNWLQGWIVGLSLEICNWKLFMRPDFLPWFKDYENIPLHSTKEPDFPQKQTPDHRPAFEVKKEIYESEIRDRYDVLFVLEDNDDCAKMYREQGLTVLKVLQ